MNNKSKEADEFAEMVKKLDVCFYQSILKGNRGGKINNFTLIILIPAFLISPSLSFFNNAHIATSTFKLRLFKS